MSKVTDNLDDISRIDAIETTANAAEPAIPANTYEPYDITILKDADIGVTVASQTQVDLLESSSMTLAQVQAIALSF